MAKIGPRNLRSQPSGRKSRQGHPGNASGRPQSFLWFTTSECYLGRMLVVASQRGIRAVNLADTEHELQEFLRREFPDPTPTRDDQHLAPHVAELQRHLAGAVPDLDLPLDLRGTPFQLRVWSAMRRIPRGQTRSYRQVAQMIGKPLAARAVARACALNPAMLVIPCHRVIGNDGSVRGGTACVIRRQKLLESEEDGRWSGVAKGLSKGPNSKRRGRKQAR